MQAQAEGARDVDEVAKRKEKEREWLSRDFCAGAGGTKSEGTRARKEAREADEEGVVARVSCGYEACVDGTRRKDLESVGTGIHAGIRGKD